MAKFQKLKLSRQSKVDKLTKMDLINQKCVPCEASTKPMTQDEAKPYLEAVGDWQLEDQGKKIEKEFTFLDFKSALDFVNKIGAVAEEEGHHPDIELSWGKVEVELSTHAIGGLSVNDFIMAAKINKITES